MNPNDVLTWGIVAFLGTGATAVFLGSWKMFNVRKDDHDKIAKNLEEVKQEILDKLASEIKSVKSAVDRVETISDEKYSILHGRSNKSLEDLGKVSDEVNYQRGVIDFMKDLILKGKVK